MSFEFTSARVKAEYNPGIKNRHSSWADLQKIYDDFATGLRIYPKWCGYALLENQRGETYFALIPHRDIIKDLVAQGWSVLQEFGEIKE